MATPSRRSAPRPWPRSWTRSASDSNAERATFVAGYAEAVEDWIALHPQWEAAIRKAVDPASLVDSRLGFGYQLYRIAPAQAAGNLEEQVQGLGDTLFGEVARIARELDRSFTGKDALSQRALSTFRRIREKLGCLAFVDYRVQPVLDSLEDWLARVPTTGSVTGALFNEGFGLMLLVSDPQRDERSRRRDPGAAGADPLDLAEQPN